MKHLTNLLGALALSSVVLTGCDSNYSSLHKNSRVKEEIVTEKDTYWSYALKLKREYPEKLGKMNPSDVYMFLQELNGHKELKIDGKVTLPIY